MASPDEGSKKDPKCPICKGAGWIVLLISRSECTDCDGTGVEKPTFDDMKTQKRKVLMSGGGDLDCEGGDYEDADYEDHEDSFLEDGLDALDFDDGIDFEEDNDDYDDWPPAQVTF